MAYIKNPFSVGQKVVCVSDFFHRLITTKEDKSNIGGLPISHPLKGVVYTIDEILGEYLRFDPLDDWDTNSPDYGWRWWKHTCFAPIDEADVYHPEHALVELTEN